MRSVVKLGDGRRNFLPRVQFQNIAGKAQANSREHRSKRIGRVPKDSNSL